MQTTMQAVVEKEDSPATTNPVEHSNVSEADEANEAAQEAELERLRREKEARAQALTLEIVGDLPYAEVKPPENVLFVCKLNPVTEDEDLHTIFSRFGPIVSCEVIRDKRTGDSLQYAFIEYENQKECEQAYFKMSGVLIDDHRIHVDFSQSVSRIADVWRTKTNANRKQYGGGFGGVAELEKKRQYRKMEPIENRQRGAEGYEAEAEALMLVMDDDKHPHETMNSGMIAGAWAQIRTKVGSCQKTEEMNEVVAISREDMMENWTGEHERIGTERTTEKGGDGGTTIEMGKIDSYHGATVITKMNKVFEKLNPFSKEEEQAKEPSAEELKPLRESYAKAGQDQVFAFYEDLSTAEKAGLYNRLSSIDPSHINQLAEKALHPPKEAGKEEAKLEPLPDSATASILDSQPEDIEQWHSSGLDLVSEGQVAVVLMAGGQGTRLGSSAPKGCFNIGLPTQKSLFQIQAERIWKIQQLAEKKSGKKNVAVPWYVMTSGPTRRPTEQFFEENNYFGLEKDNVVIFEQGILPCISNEGKILMETKAKVAVAPDGNGGIYQALLTSNVRTDMRKRGIKHIHAYCVDNCLVKVADPAFLGFAASKDVDIATKVVRKRNAKESVGLILQKNGKPDVVEYSEIDSATAEAKDSKQPDLLKFRAANIVNHYYSFRFMESIEQWAHKLPHHVAKKKIPCINTENGESIKPDKPNGIKLEQFVFDVFPLLDLQKFASMEVKREDEFSPLKNAKGTGEDDPDTSKKDIMDQGQRWIQAAGGTIESETGDEEGVEISPLISYGGEGLEFLNGRTIKAPAEHLVAEKRKVICLTALQYGARTLGSFDVHRSTYSPKSKRLEAEADACVFIVGNVVAVSPRRSAPHLNAFAIIASNLDMNPTAARILVPLKRSNATTAKVLDMCRQTVRRSALVVQELDSAATLAVKWAI
ncbi:uncharacterized protein KY384_001430 [Bacidia gigantensis]|uniref:uncharacterized protein n=1 Tax=Bacidia gigantensis TaxID=2732470 RepID=UPI001D0500AD|nr:uncharacterized protein KY384_001430 [Bacidia gigantensis]KAG8533689.1 hypothetical protein KY384_001430 [Bacidia gigantensis]